MSLLRTARAPPPCALNSIGYAPIRRKKTQLLLKLNLNFLKKSFIVVYSL